MVVKFVTKNGSRITSIAAMRTAPSLSRVELLTLKGRSPKHCSGSHRKNSAVLEALFETIDRSGRAKACRFFLCFGRPGRTAPEKVFPPTDADHRCINLSQRGSHHQAHSGTNQCDSKALRREANVPRSNLA